MKRHSCDRTCWSQRLTKNRVHLLPTTARACVEVLHWSLHEHAFLQPNGDMQQQIHEMPMFCPIVPIRDQLPERHAGNSMRYPLMLRTISLQAVWQNDAHVVPPPCRQLDADTCWTLPPDHGPESVAVKLIDQGLAPCPSPPSLQHEPLQEHGLPYVHPRMHPIAFALSPFASPELSLFAAFSPRALDAARSKPSPTGPTCASVRPQWHATYHYLLKLHQAKAVSYQACG